MVFGPPGSGKGTQAELAARSLGLIHFDTGKFLRSHLYDPVNKKNKLILGERKNMEAGRLVSPAFVANFTKQASQKIARAGFGAAYSGSPRSLTEAEVLAPELEKLYGKSSVKTVFLSVRPETSLARNKERVMCERCGMTVLRTLIPEYKHSRHCPFCGALLKHRQDDEPKVIAQRLEEYKARTEPVLAYLKKRGLKLIKVNGEQTPHEVHLEILKRLGVAGK